MTGRSREVCGTLVLQNELVPVALQYIQTLPVSLTELSGERASAEGDIYTHSEDPSFPLPLLKSTNLLRL